MLQLALSVGLRNVTHHSLNQRLRIAISFRSNHGILWGHSPLASFVGCTDCAGWTPLHCGSLHGPAPCLPGRIHVVVCSFVLGHPLLIFTIVIIVIQYLAFRLLPLYDSLTYFDFDTLVSTCMHAKLHIYTYLTKHIIT